MGIRVFTRISLSKVACVTFLMFQLTNQKGEMGSQFDPGPIIVGHIDHDNLKILIFPRLFQLQKSPRECTEEKYEINYGSLDQWWEDFVEHTGLWMSSTCISH